MTQQQQHRAFILNVSVLPVWFVWASSSFYNFRQAGRRDGLMLPPPGHSWNYIPLSCSPRCSSESVMRTWGILNLCVVLWVKCDWICETHVCPAYFFGQNETRTECNTKTKNNPPSPHLFKWSSKRIGVYVTVGIEFTMDDCETWV